MRTHIHSLTHTHIYLPPASSCISCSLCAHIYTHSLTYMIHTYLQCPPPCIILYILLSMCTHIHIYTHIHTYLHPASSCISCSLCAHIYTHSLTHIHTSPLHHLVYLALYVHTYSHIHSHTYIPPPCFILYILLSMCTHIAIYTHIHTYLHPASSCISCSLCAAVDALF